MLKKRLPVTLKNLRFSHKSLVKTVDKDNSDEICNYFNNVKYIKIYAKSYLNFLIIHYRAGNRCLRRFFTGKHVLNLHPRLKTFHYGLLLIPEWT